MPKEKTPVTLLDSRLHIEVLDSRDPNVDYDSIVNKSVAVRKHIKAELPDCFDLCHCLTLPIFHKNRKKYKLVARYWIARHIVDEDIKLFPALVFTDPDLKPEVRRIDELENAWRVKQHKPQTGSVEAAPTPKPAKRKSRKGKSGNTKTRTKARDRGWVCPFCKGPLAKSIGDDIYKNENPQDGPHRITCGYKRTNTYDCLFTASLTKPEIDKFRDKNSSIKPRQWLKRVSGKKCPTCGDKVYRRTITKDDGSTEVHERCRKLHLTEGRTCAWDIMITERPND